MSEVASKDLLNWRVASACAPETRCRACGSVGTLEPCVQATHTIVPDVACTFDRCRQCASLSLRGDILTFDHIFGHDTESFCRAYVESSAGPWEMFWPPAMVADAPTRSLLDVGCGFGFTADGWRRVMNEDALGCDPANYAAFGRELFGPHIHHAMLAEVPAAATRQFDLVYASEVIEHVDDPHAFVRELGDRLTPRGILVLTTPAAEFIEPAASRLTAMAALAPGFHNLLFSAERLRAVLLEAGFTEVIVQRHEERLVAWASRQPFTLLADAAALAPRYLGYLADTAKRLTALSVRDDGIEPIRRALLAGVHYRLYKEHVLRGLRAQAPTWREPARRDVLLDRRDGETLEVGIDRFLATSEGTFDAFLKGARLHLPQLCFVEGQWAEMSGDAKAAIAWYRRAERATRWLADDKPLANVEASSFVWYALAGVQRTGAAIGAFDDVRHAALTLAGALAARRSAYASEPDPFVATAVIVQAADALARPQPAAIGELIAALQDESASDDGLIAALVAYLRARQASDVDGDRAGAARLASEALQRRDASPSDPPPRRGAEQALALIRERLEAFRAAPASFASLFRR